MQKDISEHGLYENHYKIELYINVSKLNQWLKELFHCFGNYLMVDKFKDKQNKNFRKTWFCSLLC